MSHNTHEGIRNLSPVSSISIALLFFYFITLIIINISLLLLLPIIINLASPPLVPSL